MSAKIEHMPIIIQLLQNLPLSISPNELIYDEIKKANINLKHCVWTFETSLLSLRIEYAFILFYKRDIYFRSASEKFEVYPRLIDDEIEKYGTYSELIIKNIGCGIGMY